MADRALTLDEFMVEIRPEIERQVDERIATEPDHEFRRVLMRCRGMLVSKSLDATRIANLERKLAEAEERLRPRLVETPTA